MARQAAFALPALLLAAACEPQSQAGSKDAATQRTSGIAEPANKAAARETSAFPQGKGFDFWVLSLSWSPGYCASEGERANADQCEARPAYGFLVHGLWPQFERGYPRECPTRHSRDVPRQITRANSDLFPSAGLARHQWRAHGTCSGLSQEEYFAATRHAFAAITIPPEFRALKQRRDVSPDAVEAAFIAANPGLKAEGLAVTCDRRFLRDVRICMTRDTFEFRACREVDANDCRLKSVTAPPAR